MAAVTSYLLDTHTLLWWWFDSPELSTRARSLLADRQHHILVSSASAWEIAIKFRSGKLPAVAPLIEDISGAIHAAGFTELPISVRHANRAGLLPGDHRDPFDRMLAAQSLSEQISIVGCDPAVAGLGAQLVW